MRRLFADPYFIAALAMLIVWIVGTFFFEAPGFLHLLLSVSLFMIIWRIVVHDTPDLMTHEPRKPPRD